MLNSKHLTSDKLYFKNLYKFSLRNTFYKPSFSLITVQYYILRFDW